MDDSSGVFHRTIQAVHDRLSLNSLNQKVISGNIANLNTPGYRAKETAFEEALRESIEEQTLRLVRSRGQHLDPGDVSKARNSPQLVETGPVDLDTEMMKLAKNSVEYSYMVAMLNKKFTMLRQAIAE
ncbi:MAG TPA: flagellar basal body rod protein FlgB [Syntrophobacteraceae bacterium]|nr:flagellar basal body rod protein FlgB [Syntrophobacteraceae bacterium]